MNKTESEFEDSGYNDSSEGELEPVDQRVSQLSAKTGSQAHFLNSKSLLEFYLKDNLKLAKEFSRAIGGLTYPQSDPILQRIETEHAVLQNQLKCSVQYSPVIENGADYITSFVSIDSIVSNFGAEITKSDRTPPIRIMIVPKVVAMPVGTSQTGYMIRKADFYRICLAEASEYGFEQPLRLWSSVATVAENSDRRVPYWLAVVQAMEAFPIWNNEKNRDDLCSSEKNWHGPLRLSLVLRGDTQMHLTPKSWERAIQQCVLISEWLKSSRPNVQQSVFVRDIARTPFVLALSLQLKGQPLVDYWLGQVWQLSEKALLKTVREHFLKLS